MLRKRTTVGDGESLLRVNVLHFGEITGLTGCRREVVVVAGRRCRIGGRGCKIQSKAQASCVGLAVSGPSAAITFTLFGLDTLSTIHMLHRLWSWEILQRQTFGEGLVVIAKCGIQVVRIGIDNI